MVRVTRPSFALAFYHLVLLSACQGGQDSADLVLLAPHDSFSFFVLGDWGMGTDVQRSVAESINTEAQRVEDALFVLNVGDNFYKNAVGGEKQGGVESVDDPLWKEYFEDMYDGSHLKALPFVSILGNHDYMGNFTAQLDFAKTSDRFLMPERNFVSRVRNRETGATLATFVHVDTTPLVGMYDSHPENSKMAQNLLELEKEADGMKWLSATLARLAGEEGFTFVAGHHPVRSGYFSEDAVKQGIMDENMANLQAILEEYRVDAYFSGHMHALEHVHYKDVEYFLSGGGGESKVYARGEDGVGSRSWSKMSAGFVTVIMDGKGAANLIYRDIDGTELYSYTMPEPRCEKQKRQRAPLLQLLYSQLPRRLRTAFE